MPYESEKITIKKRIDQQLKATGWRIIPYVEGQSILTKAFRGKLVAQTPNDEPASLLLERIKGEKARLATEKTGRKEGIGNTRRTVKDCG